jgi:hypothetical protein
MSNQTHVSQLLALYVAKPVYFQRMLEYLIAPRFKSVRLYIDSGDESTFITMKGDIVDVRNNARRYNTLTEWYTTFTKESEPVDLNHMFEAIRISRRVSLLGLLGMVDKKEISEFIDMKYRSNVLYTYIFRKLKNKQISVSHDAKYNFSVEWRGRQYSVSSSQTTVTDSMTVKKLLEAAEAGNLQDLFWIDSEGVKHRLTDIPETSARQTPQSQPSVWAKGNTLATIAPESVAEKNVSSVDPVGSLEQSVEQAVEPVTEQRSVDDTTIQNLLVEMQSLKDFNNQMRTELDMGKAEISAVKETNANLLSEIQFLKMANEGIVNDLRGIHTFNASLLGQVNALNGQIQNLLQAQTTQSQTLASLIASANSNTTQVQSHDAMFQQMMQSAAALAAAAVASPSPQSTTPTVFIPVTQQPQQPLLQSPTDAYSPHASHPQYYGYQAHQQNAYTQSRYGYGY